VVVRVFWVVWVVAKMFWVVANVLLGCSVWLLGVLFGVQWSCTFMSQ